MPINIDVRGYGVVQFPDGMSDDQIKSALDEQFQSKAAPEKPQPPSVFADVAPKPGSTPFPKDYKVTPETLQQTPPSKEQLQVQQAEMIRTHPTPADWEMMEREEQKSTWEKLQRPGIPLPKFDTTKDVKYEDTAKAEQILFGLVPGLKELHRIKPVAARSIANQIIGIPEFMTSPMGLMAAPLGEVAPKAVSTVFSVDIAKNLIEQLGYTSSQWKNMSTAERIDSLVGMAAQTGMLIAGGAGMMGKLKPAAIDWAKRKVGIPDASKVGEAKTPDATVPPQPGQGAQQVSTAPGGGGVQQEAQPGVAQKTQIPLTPQEITKILLDAGWTPEQIGGFKGTDAQREAIARSIKEGREKADARSKAQAETQAQQGVTERAPGTMDPLDAEIDPEVAALPEAQALPVIQAEGVNIHQAKEIYRRNRVRLKLDQPAAEAPKPPPIPAPAPKPGLVPVGITANPSGTFTVKWTEHGINKKTSFKTQAEAEEWLRQKVAEGAEPVNPQLQYIAQKANQRGLQMEISTGDPSIEEPFATRRVAHNRNGVLVLDQELFEEQFNSMPHHKRVQFMDMIVDEEELHGYTTPEEALAYHNAMSPLERWLVKKRYKFQEGKDTPTAVGYEAIRGAIQRLNGTPMSEVVYEPFQARLLGLIEDWILGVKNLMAKAGRKPTPYQRRYLNELKAKVDRARESRTQQNVPRGTSEAPGFPTRDVRTSYEKGDLPEKDTAWAYNAGLGMRHVDDLKDAADVHATNLKELEELKKEAVRKPGETAEQGMARLQRRLDLVFSNQMIREAIEAATNSGSAAEDVVVVPLGERPLDYTKNHQVAEWLKENAKRLGITMKGEAPGFPERRKLKTPDIDKIPELPVDVLEKLKDAFNKGVSPLLKAFRDADPTAVIDDIAGKRPADWPLSGKDKAALIQWMKEHENEGFGMADLALWKVEGREWIAKRDLAYLQNLEARRDRLRHSALPDDLKKESMDELNRNIQRATADTQENLDEIQKVRAFIKELTGEFYPEKEPPERPPPNLDIDIGFPPPRSRKTFNHLSDNPNPDISDETIALVEKGWEWFKKRDPQWDDPAIEQHQNSLDPANRALARLMTMNYMPTRLWDFPGADTLWKYMKSNAHLGWDEVSLKSADALNTQDSLSEVTKMLKIERDFLEGLKAENKEPDTWKGIEDRIKRLEEKREFLHNHENELLDEISKLTGMPHGQIPERAPGIRGTGGAASFPEFPQRTPNSLYKVMDHEDELLDLIGRPFKLKMGMTAQQIDTAASGAADMHEHSFGLGPPIREIVRTPEGRERLADHLSQRYAITKQQAKTWAEKEADLLQQYDLDVPSSFKLGRQLEYMEGELANMFVRALSKVDPKRRWQVNYDFTEPDARKMREVTHLGGEQALVKYLKSEYPGIPIDLSGWAREYSDLVKRKAQATLQETGEGHFPEFPPPRKKRRRNAMGEYYPRDQGLFQYVPTTEHREREMKYGETYNKLLGEEQASAEDVLRAEVSSKLPTLERGMEITQDDLTGIMQSYLGSKIEPPRKLDGPYDRPRFAVMAEWARRRLGVIPDTLRLMWEDNVWSELIRAKGERLEQWVQALKLQSKLAKYVKGSVPVLRKIASVMEEADRLEAEQAKLRQEEFDKIERLEKKAGELEQNARALKTRWETTKYPDVFKKMEAEADWRGAEAEAKKIRAQADEMARYLREGKQLKSKEKPKVVAETSDLFSVEKTKQEAGTTRAIPIGPEAEEVAEPVKGKTEEETAEQRAKNFRNKAIVEIAMVLIREAEPRTKAARRTSFELDDIDFANKAASNEEPWIELSNDDRARLSTLQNVYRVGARRSSTDKVSLTKRIAVLQDKETGEVWAVSAYPDGRKGVKLMDPYGSDHMPLEKALEKYRPIYSILLKEPVDFFKWKFDDLGQFNERIGTEATKMWGDRQFYEFAGESLKTLSVEEQPEIEGTEGIEPAGVTGTGPAAKEARALAGEGRGVIQAGRKAPLTGGEVGSIVDYLHEEIGPEPSREEFGTAITNIIHRGREMQQAGRVVKRKKGVLTGEAMERREFWRPLRGMHWNVISAIQKIANFIYREKDYPGTQKQAYDEALEAIYTALQVIEPSLPIDTGKARFVGQLLGRFTRAAREVRGPSPLGYEPRRFTQPQAQGVERELDMLERSPSRKPPLKQPEFEKYQKKPLSSTPLEPTPIRQPTPEPEPEMTPERLKHLQEEAEREYPPLPRSVLETFKTVLDDEIAMMVEQKEETTSALEPQNQGPQPLETPPGAPEEPPGFPGRKAARKFEEGWDAMQRSIAAMFLRAVDRDLISAGRDAADNMTGRDSRMVGNSIRIWGGDSKDRLAAIAAVQSGGDLRKAADFVRRANIAIQEAKRDMRSKDRRTRLIAEDRLEAAEKLKEGALHFIRDPGKAEIWNLSVAAKDALKEAFDNETKHGINLQWEPHYIPGRYEAEFFNDDVVMFWEGGILGLNFRKPKMFESYWHAIEQGTYIPRSYDIADLVEHRVRQGMKSINLDAFLQSMKLMTDQVSGESIAKDPLRQRIWVPPNPKLGRPGRWKLGKYLSPGADYVPIDIGINRVPVYVRRGYEGLVEALVMKEGGISKSAVGRFFLQLTGALKHSWILMLDTFHPMRLGQMTAAALGLKTDVFNSPLGVLEYREADMAQALKAGFISKRQFDWATKPVRLVGPTGSAISMSRRQLLDVAIKQGLNIGRLQDALYRKWIDKLDVTIGKKKYGLGAYNRLVFDKFTRSLMANQVIHEFEKANKAAPGASMHDLMRDVVKDTNIYYGSLGRQGVIKNPTLREMSQLLFLAPQWVEGLVQKEARFASRLSGASSISIPGMGLKGRAARNLPYLGTLGASMGKGLVFYLAFTQALNLITRGKLTIFNDEEGHMLDAYIPIPWEGEGKGLWLSPLSVFAEISHDFVRLFETRPTVAHAIRQIGENKLGPWGRFLYTAATLESPTGERPQSLGGIAKMAGGTLVPTPITASTFVRPALHSMAPNVYRANRPLEWERQATATFLGIKTEPSRSAMQQTNRRAQRWMKEQKLRFQPYVMDPTGDPSYEKLTQALRANDEAGAVKVFRQLQEFRTDQQIFRAMKLKARAPFTGNKKYEPWFVSSLGDAELDMYSKAYSERMQDYERFIEFYSKLPSTR